MGIRIIEASAERVVGTMPVQGNTQPYGILHGGASCVLAESLGSIGSAMHAGEEPGHGRDRDQCHPSPRRLGGPGDRRRDAGACGADPGNLRDRADRRPGPRVCTARLSCLIRDAVPGLAGIRPADLGAEGSA